MRVIDVISDNTPSLSFEVFPPKSEMTFNDVKESILDIAKLQPSFMSVTYGAGGGSTKYTLDFAKSIQEEYGVPSLAHLTCVGTNKEMLGERIRLFKEAGIKSIMALRGDLTDELKEKGMKDCDYKYAADLITALKDSDPDFCIGAACYPEIHPESKSVEEDIKYLKEKVDRGVDFLTTQMFFVNNIYYNFLYKIREAGITVPVIAGVMPITRAVQVKRAIELSGCSMPQKFLRLVDKYGDDQEAMKEAGIIYACAQIIDLYANGIKHVHVYSMNQLDVAQKIQTNILKIIGK